MPPRAEKENAGSLPEPPGATETRRAAGTAVAPLARVRIASLTVGSVALGAAVVLLSVPPSQGQVKSAPVHPAPVHVMGSCPPCQGSPLEAEAWLHELDAPGAGDTLVRAAALSKALSDPHALAAALTSTDPAHRALAALLLNIESGRLPGCTDLGSTSAVQLADRLDHDVVAARSGKEPASLSDLLALARGANHGMGLPVSCVP